MRALVTNDDGIDSPGLGVLAAAAAEAGLEVVVAAPHQERSGSGAALVATTTDGRLLLEPRTLPGLPSVPAYGVEASPALIAWAGVLGAFGPPPDLVLSGINKGPNTGRSILHSGTVGAAFTAVSHDIPAVAVSLAAAEPVHWDTAAAVTTRTLRWLLRQDRPRPLVLNVNVPDVPEEELKGLTRAPLASFGAVQAAVGEADDGFVTLTFTEIDPETQPDTDAGLQAAGWATVTPLTLPRPAEDFGLDGLTDR